MATIVRHNLGEAEAATIAVGAGLTFAGATGTYGLARLLMKMPWNRLSSAAAEATAGVCAVGGGASAACQASTDPPQ